MVLPHPDDATHYQMTPEARALWETCDEGEQVRFRITMQALAMVLDIKPAAKLMHPLPQTADDGRPLYTFRWHDLEVTFTQTDDGIPIVQHFLPDPLPPPRPNRR